MKTRAALTLAAIATTAGCALSYPHVSTTPLGPSDPVPVTAEDLTWWHDYGSATSAKLVEDAQAIAADAVPTATGRQLEVDKRKLVSDCQRLAVVLQPALVHAPPPDKFAATKWTDALDQLPQRGLCEVNGPGDLGFLHNTSVNALENFALVARRMDTGATS